MKLFPIKPHRLLLWGLAFGVPAVASTACDDAIRSVATPKVAILPSNGFTFAKIPLSSDPSTPAQATRQVEILNEGNGELLIAKVSVDGLTDRGEFRLRWARTVIDSETTGNIGFEFGGADDFSYPLRVAADESVFFYLDYRPASEDSRAGSRGAIRLETNEGANPNVNVPVTVSATGAEISVFPQALNFDRVSAGQAENRDLTITNIGSADLNVERIQIGGSLDFTPLIDGRDPRRGVAEVLTDPDGDGTPGLAPNKSFVVRVRFAPQFEGPDSGELTIDSNDPNRPIVSVPLVANAETPCLRTNPPALEYPTSLINRTDSRPLAIESCGGSEVNITAIYLAEGSDPAFALDADSVPEVPFAMPAVIDSRPPDPRYLRVSFTPREQRIYNGKLIIESDDPVVPRREVSLLGRGELNACPQARATQDEYNVVPLDVVTLDGSPSIDQDGPGNAPVGYEWVIVSSPEGSLSAPVERFADAGQPANGGQPDDTTTPTSRLFVDLAGVYVLELRVTDNLGLDSVACNNPARVVIVATPEEAIHVQLTWRTPNDPNPTDNIGTDLDLHLLHPNAQNWFQIPWDCHYGMVNPDWGQPESPQDDPSLDIDDINGGGPENINLNQPEDTSILGAPYLIGVHYYQSRDRVTQEDFGSAFARVRVFIEGELAWDFTDGDNPGEREMEAAEHFWDVAQIDWPARTVTTRNRYYTQRP